MPSIVYLKKDELVYGAEQPPKPEQNFADTEGLIAHEEVTPL